MSTQFSWGFPEDGAGVDVMAPQPEAMIREALRVGVNASTFPPMEASPTGQGSSGLGIQNVKRGYLNLVVPFDSSVVGVDFQTSSKSFVDVSAELTGSLLTSGRPVMIMIRCGENGSLGASDTVYFSVRIDGAEITGSLGLVYKKAGPVPMTTGVWFAQPSAGTHTYSMVWKVDALATTTPLMSRSSRPFLTVVEL